MNRVKLPIRIYYDYRSPFSYLAKDPLYSLERNYDIHLQWLPFEFPMEQVVSLETDRSSLQWKKVKYFYIDARRFANDRGIKLYGPKKVFDSSYANIGALYAQKFGKEQFISYHNQVFELFFNRKLDLENVDELVQIMKLSGISTERKEFENYVQTQGRGEYTTIGDMADKDGVFGVPSMVVDGELFFGNDRVPWVAKKLDQMGLKVSSTEQQHEKQ
jgi:2-hydroxychromene-2-carboxylate isomerase